MATPRRTTVRRAARHAAGQLLSLLSVLSQFFGAFNALQLDWIRIAPDLKPWAAGLSSLISIAGFLIAWSTASALLGEGTRQGIGRRLWLGLLGMVISFIGYWVLNVAYTADGADKWLDILARLGFLVLYSLPFGFLSYAFVLALATGENEEQ